MAKKQKKVNEAEPFSTLGREELKTIKPIDLGKKAACEAAHQGQQGWCDDNGGWHPGI